MKNSRTEGNRVDAQIEAAAEGIAEFRRRARLPEAIALREQLTKATDRLNGLLEDAERALGDRWPGRATAVEIDAERTLVFAPWKGRHRLLILKSTGSIDVVANSPREVRVAAARLLWDLADQLPYADEEG